MVQNSAGAEPSDPIIIKKYANRRLYNTATSRYITLDYLAQMTRDDVHFKVLDAKTGDDITHNVLTQIIMDEEASGQNMLPVNFLRQLISLYGDSMQAMVPSFLEASMDSFRKNQRQFQEAIEGAIASGPFAEMARQNLKFMEAAREAFAPPMMGTAPWPSTGEAPAAPAAKSDEMDALRQQIAEMQAKLDRLDKKD
jgi:polyhydroxyalkanoate synthesis repressor PhaR